MLDWKFGIREPEPGLFETTVKNKLQRRTVRAAVTGVMQMRARDAEQFGEDFDREIIPIVKLDELAEPLDCRYAGTFRCRRRAIDEAAGNRDGYSSSPRLPAGVSPSDLQSMGTLMVGKQSQTSRVDIPANFYFCLFL